MAKNTTSPFHAKSRICSVSASPQLWTLSSHQLSTYMAHLQIDQKWEEAATLSSKSAMPMSKSIPLTFCKLNAQDKVRPSLRLPTLPSSPITLSSQSMINQLNGDLENDSRRDSMLLMENGPFGTGISLGKLMRERQESVNRLTDITLFT